MLMTISENINLYKYCCEKGVNARYFESTQSDFIKRIQDTVTNCPPQKH
jgi:hypothetical protein